MTHYAGGVCRSHYHIDLKAAETRLCSIPGCGKPLNAKGLCQMHLFRLRNHGSAEVITPKARGSLAERFWRKVVKAGPDDCWLWTGNMLPSGYGQIGRGGRRAATLLAHRAAVEIATGEPVPSHLVVMHSCDNPSCVNPAHLSLGTNMDNSHDMIAKGRNVIVSLKGIENPHAKLTPEAVRDIRSSRMPQAALARKYRVSEATIAAVIHGRTWRHVT